MKSRKILKENRQDLFEDLEIEEEDGKMKKAKTNKAQISKSEDTKFVEIKEHHFENTYRITFKCDMSEFEDVEDFIDNHTDIIKEEIEIAQ